MPGKKKPLLDDHAKVVAIRNSHRNFGEFQKWLRFCGWEDHEIIAMWTFAQRYINKESFEPLLGIQSESQGSAIYDDNP